MSVSILPHQAAAQRTWTFSSKSRYKATKHIIIFIIDGKRYIAILLALVYRNGWHARYYTKCLHHPPVGITWIRYQLGGEKQGWWINRIVSERTCSYCSDVIMGAMVSQITSLAIVYSNVYSGADQRKHQSSAWLAFVRGNHRWPVNSPHTWPVTRKMFPYDDVIMWYWLFLRYLLWWFGYPPNMSLNTVLFVIQCTKTWELTVLEPIWSYCQRIKSLRWFGSFSSWTSAAILLTK